MTVTANGLTSPPFGLVIRKPARLVPVSPFAIHNSNALYGYVSYIYYKILDQFGADFPATKIPLNEIFTSETIPDYPGGTNWDITNVPGGAPEPPLKWPDQISGSQQTTPKALPPGVPLGTQKVDHLTGEWRVGSSTPGKGVRVQTNTWQKYQDHAIHTDIVSPAPQ